MLVLYYTACYCEENSAIAYELPTYLHTKRLYGTIKQGPKTTTTVRTHFPTSRRFVSQGEEGHHMFVVEKGSLEVIIDDEVCGGLN